MEQPRDIATITDLMEHARREFADREAFRSFGKPLTYRDLLVHAAKVTSWLQQAGLAKGDRVAIMMPNVLPFPVCLYGALLGGYTVTAVNPLYTARELAFQLADSGARALFMLEPFAQVAAEALKQAPVPHVVVAALGDLLGTKGLVMNLVARRVKRVVPPWRIPGHVGFAHVLRGGSARPPAAVTIGENDTALLQYTGGTTGVAKAAILSHRNVIAHTLQLCDYLAAALGDTAEDHRVVTAMPMYHVAALTCQVLAVPVFGGCCVLVANPRDIAGLIKTLAGERFTIMSGVNTLYLALLEHPDIGSVDFSRCRVAFAGAMATQKTISDRWQALTGRPLIEGYGLSEATGVVTINPTDLGAFGGSIGRPLPRTEVSIRDAQGNPVPDGGHGEICMRGPQVMAGYWNRPDETAKVMTSDGFMRTGDTGSIDDKGFVHLLDRSKDMVLVSGFNVYPNEVEAILAAHPQILEAAVIGVADVRTGEAVAASIVRRDASLTEDALADYCRQNLAAYKCPKQIEFVSELPKSVVGKVLRRLVRERWAAKHSVTPS